MNLQATLALGFTIPELLTELYQLQQRRDKLFTKASAMQSTTPVRTIYDLENYTNELTGVLVQIEQLCSYLPVNFCLDTIIDDVAVIAVRYKSSIVFIPETTWAAEHKAAAEHQLENKVLEECTVKDVLLDLFKSMTEKTDIENDIQTMSTLLPDNITEVLTIDKTYWAATRFSGGSIKFTPLTQE
jgi:hypothetical protein